MALTIGEQLRLAREARGIGLREICDQTRISVHYLEAIEANDYKRLPGGVFNRSFIKAYAKCVGYDEREAIEGYTRYLREHDDSSDEVSTHPIHSKVYTDTPATKSPVLTVVLAILILALLTAGALAALHWFQKRAELTPSASHRLWSAVACYRVGQSGDKSPHSKEALCASPMYNDQTSETNDLGLHDYT
ncbi:MAG TPA: helix-turn-helix domain-containing protein [Pyrinomonadaceae bacterium]|jgi:cytoskeletal protein RodZ|nr:helix-turn-helix domain-containing protein [Pyrinomonadaceae bacterium]